MSPEDIERRLRRASFLPPQRMPLPEQYASWPEQARLMCAGAREELNALQRRLREKFGVAEPVVEAPTRPDRENLGGAARLLALMLGFFLLSLLAWLLAAPCRGVVKCPVIAVPQPVVAEPPTVVTVPPPVVTVTKFDLSSDLVFDYRRFKPTSPKHEARIKLQLKELLDQHDDIEIISIQGHTDPIGSTADNAALGAKRAEFMRKLIKELRADAEMKRRFKDEKELVGSSDNGPSLDEFDIWSFCFHEFNVAKGKSDPRPLVSLNPSKNDDGRVPCDQADSETGRGNRYPACARMPLPTSGRALNPNYPARAERLREMIACLAPMRHVEIKFRSRRIVMDAAAKNGG